jgi:hypothetical protein
MTPACALSLAPCALLLRLAVRRVIHHKGHQLLSQRLTAREVLRSARRLALTPTMEQQISDQCQSGFLDDRKVELDSIAK